MRKKPARTKEAKVAMKRIVVGHDGSQEADAAFESALELASLSGAHLTVVSVATPPEPPTVVETEASLEAATQHYEEIFVNLRRRATECTVKLDTRVLVGHPAEQIIRVASDLGADLIVVGHRGRSGIRQWLFGSTSQRVISYASCSVLVVRHR